MAIENVASVELHLGPMSPNSVLSGAPKSGARILTSSHDGNSIVWVWECTPGSFVWHYGEDETVYIISGEVFISTGTGEERRLGEGDMAVFPGGISCNWRVTQPIKKIAITRKDLPRLLGFAVRAGHKLVRTMGLRQAAGQAIDSETLPNVGQKERAVTRHGRATASLVLAVFSLPCLGGCLSTG